MTVENLENRDSTTTAAPAIDIQAIKAEIEADLDKRVEQRLSSTKQDSLSKAEVQTMLAEHNKTLAKIISGEDTSSAKRLPALAEAILTDPDEVFRIVQENADQRSEEKAMAIVNRFREEQEQSMVLASTRPDIWREENNRGLFNRLYDKTDSELSPRERVEQATKDYDLLLESAGAGKADDRIKKAQSFSTSSSPKGSREDAPVSEEESYTKELAARQERRRKITNNNYQ